MLEKESEDVFYASRIAGYAFYFAVAIISFITIMWLLGLLTDILLKIPAINDWINMWGYFAIFLLVIFIVFGFAKNITAKVVLTENGIEHSDIFRKIVCSWGNIQQIEVISQVELSEKGEVISKWTDYNIYTCEQAISLKGNDFWDTAILKNIYNVVIS